MYVYEKDFGSMSSNVGQGYLKAQMYIKGSAHSRIKKSW